MARIQHIRLSVDGAEVISRKLYGLERLPKNQKPILKKIYKVIQQAWGRVFNRQGPGWAPLKPSTVRNRESMGYPGDKPIGINTGEFVRSLVGRGSMTIERYDNKSAEFGAFGIKAAVFNKGSGKQVAREINVFDEKCKRGIVYEYKEAVRKVIK